MLLIHLLPYNRDNHPWCVDIISVNQENAAADGYSRIVVTPPAGVCPSPAYAVSFDCDCIEAIKLHGMKPSEAAARLAAILKGHEHLVFSGCKSYLMFRNLLCNLQMTDVLKGKTVSSFRSIVNAAVVLKNLYYPNAQNNLKKLCAHLGFQDGLYIKNMHAVFADLHARAPKLLNYFVKRELAPSVSDSLGKIILGIAEERFYVFVPVMVTSEYILGIDISTSKEPCVLPLNGSVSYSVSSAINAPVARELGTDFESIRKRFGEVQAYNDTSSDEYGKLMDGFDEIMLNGSREELNTEAYKSASGNLRRLGELVRGGVESLSAAEVSAYASKVTGSLRTSMLDYLYLEEYPLPLGFEEVYRDIVAARINGARDVMISELEYATAEAEKNNSRESLQRLSNLYKFLSE